MRTGRLALGVVLAIGFLSTEGCSTSRTIDVEDNTVFFPSLKLSYQIEPRTEPSILLAGQGEPSPAVGPAVRSPHGYSLATDIEVGYGMGEDSMFLRPNDRVEIDDASLRGGGRLEIEYWLFQATGQARIGAWFWGLIAAEGIVGVGVTTVGMRISRGGGSESDSDSGFGPVIGGRLTVRPHWRFQIHGQVTRNSFLTEESVGSLTAIEFIGQFNTLPGLGFFGGWRNWTYWANRESESDYVLEMAGPIFGVSVTF